MNSAYISIAITVVIQLIVATAIVATVRQMVTDTKMRVDKIEERIQSGPINYVPRSELQAMLSAIREKIDDIKALLHAIMARSGSRDFTLSGLQASAALMQYSLEGFALTEQSEALRLVSYPDDGKGIWTIGWGHTGRDVVRGLVITRDQAVALLRLDTASAVASVNQLVHVPLTQHQFDSLVDFVFNEGAAHFLTSTLLRELNASRYSSAASHFADWVSAGGKRLGGLVRRRADEAAMFMEAV